LKYYERSRKFKSLACPSDAFSLSPGAFTDNTLVVSVDTLAMLFAI